MYALVEHEVKNFSVWKKHFDKSKKERKMGGATGKESIFRDIKNPNKLIIGMEWDNKRNFEKTINSDEIKQVMEEAGVIKVPSVTVYEGNERNMQCSCQVMEQM